MKSMDLPASASAQARRPGQTQPISLASSESLSKKVIRGGIWVFTLRFTNRGLGFIRTIILARLLAPSDFGLLGIAMLAISTLETFSQTGFQAALIQNKENVESYLDTAWTISVIRGMFLFILLFFGAPLVAKFFNSAEATLIIRVIAVTILLSGIRNIGIVFFQKELEFNKLFFYESSATVADLTVAIALALILRDVWALVWGGLAAHCVRVFMSYMVHSYRPRISFEKAKFQELFGFGKWILGSSILIFLITQGDDVLVGKMLGVTALGFYQMAFLISNLPATEIAHVISQVTFPAYSKFQDDLPKLRGAYLKVLQLTAFVSTPLAGGIFVLGPEFTEIFLGEKWMPMVPAIQILCLVGLARSIISTTSPVFSAMKKPGIGTKCQTMRLLLLCVLIYPFTIRWGLLGVSYAVLSSVAVSAFGFSSMVIKTLRCRFRKFAKMIILPLINTGIMCLTISFLNITIESVDIFYFILLILVALINYILVSYLFDKFFKYGIQKLFKETLVRQ